MCDVAIRRATARRNAFVMRQICDGRTRACHRAPAPRWACPGMPIARRPHRTFSVGAKCTAVQVGVRKATSRRRSACRQDVRALAHHVQVQVYLIMTCLSRCMNVQVPSRSTAVLYVSIVYSCNLYVHYFNRESEQSNNTIKGRTIS